jgi:hypothetical protein
VSKVKQLTMHASPGLLQALREGEVSIHRASVWLRTPEKQLDQLRLHRNLRGITLKIDSLLKAHRKPHSRSDGDPDIHRIGRALTAMGPEQSTSILVTTIHALHALLRLAGATDQKAIFGSLVCSAWSATTAHASKTALGCVAQEALRG